MINVAVIGQSAAVCVLSFVAGAVAVRTPCTPYGCRPTAAVP